MSLISVDKSLSSMSHVDFKIKGPCRHVEFKGQGPLPWRACVPSPLEADLQSLIKSLLCEAEEGVNVTKS